MSVQLTWLDRINPRLHQAGHSSNQAAYIDPRRVIHDHELMLFGHGGRFEAVFADRTLPFSGDSFLIIPPGVWHVCRSVGPGSLLRAWVHFDWTPADPRIPEAILTYAPARPDQRGYHPPPQFVPPCPLHGPIPDPAAAFELHRRIEERFHRQGGRLHASSRALLLELLLLLLAPEAVAPGRGGAKSFAAQGIREALDGFAQLPFKEAGSIRALLAKRGQSYDHQARIFLQAFGITPLQYVNSLRIDRACRLLAETVRPVAGIAAELGIDDPVYFCRLFRKHTGVTPLAWRQAQGATGSG